MSIADTQVQGTATASDGAADKTIFAAVAGKSNYLQYAVITVSTAAVGGGGLVKLEDAVNGTVLFQGNANSVTQFFINLGEFGYQLTAGNLLNLTVDSAVTTQATAQCIAVGVVR